MKPLFRFALVLVVALIALRVFAPPAEDDVARVIRETTPSVGLLTVIQKPGKIGKGEAGTLYGTASVLASNATDAIVITAAHVLDNAARIIFTAKNVQTPAVLLAADRKLDVALLRLPKLGNLTPIKLAPQSRSGRELESGDPITVLGYPIPDAFEDAQLELVVSSYSGRLASVRSSMLEIGVPIVPGESGGPVIDTRTGGMIGMVLERIDDEPEIGFALPLDRLQPMILQAVKMSRRTP